LDRLEPRAKTKDKRQKSQDKRTKIKGKRLGEYPGDKGIKGVKGGK